MTRTSVVRAACTSVLPVLFAALTLSAQAPQPSSGFQPVVGQPGKDVVWVPTPQNTVDKMLELAKITPQDYLIDLGSGDGRLVITAARRGLKAHGIEYNQDMVDLSIKNAAAAGVSDRATFAKADLFESDFSKASVITMFLLPDINLKLRPTILNMKPGTRIVSNSFTMGDWSPDQTAVVTDCPNYCTALFWVVPAKVAGTWKMPQGELNITQTYQNFTGTLGNAPIANGKLVGDQISFEAAGVRYEGQVNGNTIQGTMGSTTKTPFTASR
jgi:hypothetical protein